MKMPFVVDLGFEDDGLLFEDEMNSENEDDEELRHGRTLLRKLVTNDKSLGKNKREKKDKQYTFEEEEPLVGDRLKLVIQTTLVQVMKGVINHVWTQRKITV
ncbi:unnamed protein product [Cuscuta epithymum]|uniref:Uncharacterized protein n=1 Tax=Cuscuta epithymum TaxID=186058 RepID=A0AAV0DFL6_9ASTE|nr:unnamed protein product [Cuscuta epithymum]